MRSPSVWRRLTLSGGVSPASPKRQSVAVETAASSLTARPSTGLLRRWQGHPSLTISPLPLRDPIISVTIETMTTERTTGGCADASGLVRRAAVHAALSDAARLRIVDTLSLSDASPTELQTLLGITSNLLAHHLGVLEREGLLIRHRSQADRRRSDLRLLPTALDSLLPAGVIAAPRVVFVCTANSARSQLAAALWRRSSTVPVASAGTHPAQRIAPGAVAVARRHDLRLPRTRPRRLGDVLHADDFVVTVCDNAHEEAPKPPASLRTGPRPRPRPCTGPYPIRSARAPTRRSMRSWPSSPRGSVISPPA